MSWDCLKDWCLGSWLLQPEFLSKVLKQNACGDLGLLTRLMSWQLVAAARAQSLAGKRLTKTFSGIPRRQKFTSLLRIQSCLLNVPSSTPAVGQSVSFDALPAAKGFYRLDFYLSGSVIFSFRNHFKHKKGAWVLDTIKRLLSIWWFLSVFSWLYRSGLSVRNHNIYFTERGELCIGEDNLRPVLSRRQKKIHFFIFPAFWGGVGVSFWRHNGLSWWWIFVSCKLIISNFRYAFSCPT